MEQVKGNYKSNRFGRLGLRAALLPLFLLTFFGGVTKVMAHGGEDHGEQKPKTETTAKGSVLHTVKLGDLEITLKHAPLEPDMATAGRLFVTRYATNEAVDAENLQIAVESANGSMTEVPFEKGSTAGTYTVQIPALPEGGYTLRATVTAGGKTSTATFSGVEVSHQESAGAGGTVSWSQFFLTTAFLIFGIALFAGLVYFAVRVIRHQPLREEAVSA